MVHKCILCDGFTTNNLFLFVEHLENHENIDNISCKQELNDLKKRKDKCNICDINISNYYNYKKHRTKSCLRPKIIGQLEKLNDSDELMLILKEIKSKIRRNDDEISSINNNNNNVVYNNVQYGQNNNMISIVNNLHQENLDVLKLSKNEHQEFQQLLLKTLGTHDGNEVKALRKFQSEAIKNTFIMLFEEIYFNTEFPENHNIYINSKTYYRPFHVYVNNRWSKEGDLDTIRDVIIRLKDIFSEWITEVVDYQIYQETDQEQIKQFKEYLMILQEDLNIFVRQFKQNKVSFQNAKKLIKEFFDIAYRKKNIVEETFNKTKSKPLRRLRLNLKNK